MKPPYSLSKTPPDIRRLPPRFGEHTAEVLRELGYDDAQIATMLDAGAAVAEAESATAATNSGDG